MLSLSYLFNNRNPTLCIIVYFNMKLVLQKPICFFDIEATGIDIVKDRIVELAILKIFPNGNQESFRWLVNPEINIPNKVIKIHGITNEQVADEPTFKELSVKIYQIIKGCDLAGYNSNRYDIPLLAEELIRSDIDFNIEKINTVDVQTIFHKKEQRTLSAAYKFYCKEELENAHSALADTKATYEVLKSQLEHYPDLKNDMKFLSEFSTHKKNADFAGFIGLNKKKEEIFNFGKHKGKTIAEILEKEPGYYNWFQNADFPLFTKKIITRVRLRSLNTKL